MTDDEVLVEGEVIDAYFEDSDDPDAENGLAIVLRADIADPRDLWGKRVVIKVASRSGSEAPAPYDPAAAPIVAGGAGAPTEEVDR